LGLDDNRRVLARLYNPSRSPAQTSLTCHDVQTTVLYKTDLFGENGVQLPAGEKITVPARGITTVVLQVE